jgi:copper chaperone CopZ
MSVSRHVVLNVPDVSCMHCKAAVEGAVAGVAGVEAVDVDVDAKSCTVHLEPGADLGAVKAAIEDEGYTVVGEHEFAL